MTPHRAACYCYRRIKCLLCEIQFLGVYACEQQEKVAFTGLTDRGLCLLRNWTMRHLKTMLLLLVTLSGQCCFIDPLSVLIHPMTESNCKCNDSMWTIINFPLFPHTDLGFTQSGAPWVVRFAATAYHQESLVSLVFYIYAHIIEPFYLDYSAGWKGH